MVDSLLKVELHSSIGDFWACHYALLGASMILTIIFGDGLKEAKSKKSILVSRDPVKKSIPLWELIVETTLRGAFLIVLVSGHRLVIIRIIIILGKGRKKRNTWFARDFS